LSRSYWRRLAASQPLCSWSTFAKAIGPRVGVDFEDRPSHDPMLSWRSDEMTVLQRHGHTCTERLQLDHEQRSPQPLDLSSTRPG
jgi:hypothetical protein